MATFPRWKELGRTSAKARRRSRCVSPSRSSGRLTTDGRDDDPDVFARFVYRPNWFVLAQTEGADPPPPSIPTWDAARALAALDVTEIPFDASTATVSATRATGRSRSTRSTRCRTRRGFTSWRMCCSAIPSKAFRPRWRDHAAEPAGMRSGSGRPAVLCGARACQESSTAVATSKRGGALATRFRNAPHSAS